MKPVPRFVRTVIRAVGTIAPGLMAAIAYRQFWDLGRPATVKDRARSVHDRAVVSIVSVGEREARVYSWGTGSEVVLLVHGWRGRASQFADVVRALESPHRTVVAFDAPGNGASPGDRTDLLDYVALIRLVTDRFGGPTTVIAHSFGSLAAFVAAREGVRVGGIVSIAGVGSFDYVVSTFTAALALPRRATRALRQRIAAGLFVGQGDIWRRFVSELDPTDTATPLLVIHDSDDRAVDVSQATAIAEAHTGPVSTLITHGLGHTRVLSDPAILDAISEFVLARSVDEAVPD